MKLSDKELEIMKVLWKSDAPMTATDIITAASERTWQDISIHGLLKSLLEKEAIQVDHYRPTSAKSARAYIPSLTVEEYAVRDILELDVDVKKLYAVITNKLFGSQNHGS